MTDLNGYNLLTFCIQEFSWECLTELVNVCGAQSLENKDPSADSTPKNFAEKIGFGEIFEKWNISFIEKQEVDWESLYRSYQSQTLLFFHSMVLSDNFSFELQACWVPP